MRALADILQQLSGSLSTENGLSPEGVAASRQRYGSNQLTPLPREPIWRKFLEKFDEPIIKILLAAALLSMAVDLFKGHAYTAGLVCVGLVVVGAVVLYVLKLGEWIPSLMFGMALVTFFVGLAMRHPSVEGLAVMVAVILATGVAFLSEYKSDREFEVLNARRDEQSVKVLRGGKLVTVPLEEVVVGDAVVLEMGDEIPADGRLVKSTDLYIDQSLMTGEAEPVKKGVRPPDDTSDGPEQPGCLYRGTQVVDGVGQMLVTEVGDHTYLGQIARKLSAEEGEEDEAEEGKPEDETARVKRKLTIAKDLTPLQLKLQNLAELISKVGYIAAVLIFLALIFRGMLNGTVYIPTSGPAALAVFSEILDAFVLMVIIIVVAVPEGLPMSVTVSLALAMQKMTRANSLVRQLVACETVGSATVICSDKTGTLTQNRMQVVRLSLGGKLYDRGAADWLPPGPPPADAPMRPIDWITLNAAVNSTANLEEKNGRLQVVGNSTEGSLLQWLHEGKAEYPEVRLRYPALYQIHFSSERKRMTTVVRHGGVLVTFVKGAPEWVLAQATHLLGADGSIRELTPEDRQQILAQLKDSASQAMRTLGFGHVALPADLPATEDALHARREVLESKLVFDGFVAIRDPLRDDVKGAVDQCRDAGIKVKMVTGDNVETARAIAYDIGLVDARDAPINTPEATILTSDRFNELTDEQLKEVLPRLAVLARARPLDKFRLVKLLQELGEVVAVTGDGTNDAPALKKADVGLAMGIAGTEVAKEASKIVLLDDAFSTIVKAVHWGRSLYENIQRFIQFQLTINVSALTIAFLGPLVFGVKAPFTVLQLLWINVIMDTFASIALCSEEPRPGVMKVPPKRKDEDILTPAMKTNILVTACFFVVMMLGLLVGMKSSGADSQGHPKGGWFANLGSGLWSFESAGTRVALPPEYLQHVKKTEWRVRIPEEVKEDPAKLEEVPPAVQHLEEVNAQGEVSFTVFQVALFFSIYVFFQVWNQINCRSLTPSESGFHRIWTNPYFLTIAAVTAVGQVLIITFGGSVFKVEPLGPLHWLLVILYTASVLVFAEVARVIRRAQASPPTPIPVPTAAQPVTASS